MARASGLSVSTVQRVWRAFGLQPHRMETFKLSTDPGRVPAHGVGTVFLDSVGYRGQAARAGMLTARSSLNGAMVSRVM